jgi:predicted transcriptional regulator
MADNTLIQLTADIVAAHVGHNAVPASDIPIIITSVHAALAKLGQPTSPEPVKPEPAVSVRSSVKPDYIVCLEDGKKLKALKRYLRTHYDMSPDEYRAKWGLPTTYPMVAPSYSERRRELAHKIGLGKQPSRPAAQKKASPTKRAARGAPTGTSMSKRKS